MKQNLEITCKSITSGGFQHHNFVIQGMTEHKYSQRTLKDALAISTTAQFVITFSIIPRLVSYIRKLSWFKSKLCSKSSFLSDIFMSCLEAFSNAS